MLLQEATYQDNIDQLNKVLAYLFNHQQMSYIQKQTWDKILKEPDLVTKYQKLMTFYNDKKNKFPDAREILKKSAPEIKPAGAKSEPLSPAGGISPERMEQQIKYYNYAIRTLRDNKQMSNEQWRQYLEIGKTAKDQEELLLALSQFYKNNKFPKASDVVKQAQAAYQQKANAAKASTGAAATGLDTSKFSPEKQKIIDSYINYLQQITGKKVTFA